MKKTTKKGFTLVELVIVIAIIAILAAVLIPTFSGVVKKANESKALQSARNCYTELTAEYEGDLTKTTSGDAITEGTAITETGVTSATVTHNGTTVSKIVFKVTFSANNIYTVTYTLNTNVWEVTGPAAT